MSEVKSVGIDEKSGARRGRVLHVSEGCRGESVAGFVEALKAHGGRAEANERCTTRSARHLR